MSMNPRRLPQHHHLLLLKQDFARLGSGSTIHKQSWLAEVESALTEAAITKHTKKKKCKSVLVKCIQNRKVAYCSSIISSFEPPIIMSKQSPNFNKQGVLHLPMGWRLDKKDKNDVCHYLISVVCV
jgi:hypothetical protein